MWVLQLNPMSGKAENLQPVAWAETKDELQNFLDSQKVEPYCDGNWSKQFKKDGPLEWFNGTSSLNQPIINVGTLDDWIKETVQRFNSLRDGLFSA